MLNDNAIKPGAGSCPADPTEYPYQTFDVKADAVSLMYDPELLDLADRCVNVAQSAINALNSSPGEEKPLDAESATWLRNHLLQVAKRLMQHAAGVLDFFEMRPPRGETNKLTEQLDRVLVNTIRDVDTSVFRGLLMLLQTYRMKYVGIGGRPSRAHVLACAVVDASVSNPGRAIQIPAFEHGRVGVDSRVMDIIRGITAAAPEYKSWFRLEKCALVRPYGKDSFEEYHLYALTFQEPAEGQKGYSEEDDEE
jgi:hypothetical protein